MKCRTAAALAALLGACSSGTIEGDIVVGAGFGGREIVSVLWREDASGTLQAVEVQPMGATEDSGGRYLYRFVALQKATYVVGAWLDANGDGSPECDLHAWDSQSPLEVDPDVPAKETAHHDVYLGTSAPGRITVTGTVHLSARARAVPVSVLALDRPINDPAGNLLAETEICGTAMDVPWAAYNLPPKVHFVAIADIASDDGSRNACAERLDNDLFAFGRPVSADAATTVVRDEDLWLDTDAPGAGTLAGTVELSAALPSVRVQMTVFSTDPSRDASAAMIGIVNVSPGEGTSVPFHVGSLPLGKLYLVAFPMSREPDCRLLQGSPVYRRTRDGIAPFELTAEVPSVTDIAFPVGVGRVSGTIHLLNAPATLQDVFVVASQPDAGTNVVQQEDRFSGQAADGTFATGYELWGLQDGTFDLSIVPDLSGDGWYQDEVDSGRYFTNPTKVTVVGGDRKGLDFEVDLSTL